MKLNTPLRVVADGMTVAIIDAYGNTLANDSSRDCRFTPVMDADTAAHFVACVNFCVQPDGSPWDTDKINQLCDEEMSLIMSSELNEALSVLREIAEACDKADADDQVSLADTFTKELEDRARAILAKIEA